VSENKYPLNDDNIKLEVLRLQAEGFSTRSIAKILNISKTTVSDFLAGRTYGDFWIGYNEKPFAKGTVEHPDHKMKKLSGELFVLTSAQNNTYVFNSFFNSIKNYCERRNAQLIVGTYTYNKNKFQNLSKDSNGVWYDPLITPYIRNEKIRIADGLVWNGELNILPTAVNPLSGLQSYTMNDSSIIPHAKLQMESVPTFKTDPCKFMYTTGTCTLRNYIEQKEGQKASFHHVFSALVVEVDKDGDWFVRQLVSSDDGSFQDLTTVYHPNGTITENVNIEAINYGDIHVEQANILACGASFLNDKGFGNHPQVCMLDILKPKYQFVHDVLDFNSRNHHTIDNPYIRFKQWLNDREYVADDIEMVANFLYEMKRPFSKIVVVESNHDLAIKKWLLNADYKKDPANAITFLKLQLETYMLMNEGVSKYSILEMAIKCLFPKQDINDIQFLVEDESFRICNETGNGIECGWHGHLGINGARGSTNAFRKLNSRMNVGHSHAASIKDGVYTAGVLGNLDMKYNKGADAWSHSNIITYPNGKRSIVTIKNGKWRKV